MRSADAIKLAWFAFAISERKPSYKHTYGFGKATILAALGNSIVLLVAMGALLYESLGCLFIADVSESLNAVLVMVVADFGVVINGVTVLLFLKDQKSDRNFAALCCTWLPMLQFRQAWSFFLAVCNGLTR